MNYIDHTLSNIWGSIRRSSGGSSQFKKEATSPAECFPVEYSGFLVTFDFLGP